MVYTEVFKMARGCCKNCIVECFARAIVMKYCEYMNCKMCKAVNCGFKGGFMEPIKKSLVMEKAFS